MKILMFALFSMSAMACPEAWKVSKSGKNYVLESGDLKAVVKNRGPRPQFIRAVPRENFCLIIYRAASAGTHTIVEDYRALVLDTKEAKVRGDVLHHRDQITKTGTKSLLSSLVWEDRLLKVTGPDKKIEVIKLR